MLRFASSPTMYFTWSMWPGERYAGSPWAISRRPGERLTMKMPLAAIRSRSQEIRRSHLRRVRAVPALERLHRAILARRET